ncbi:unnamed protein product [Closterium sp. NIES-53]
MGASCSLSRSEEGSGIPREGIRNLLHNVSTRCQILFVMLLLFTFCVSTNIGSHAPQALGIELAKIAGMSTDGASVMMGSKNGLVARLRLRIPHLVSSHCIAHREALAAKDAADAIPEFDMVDGLIRQVAEGDAVLRTVTVFPALIVMLSEWDETLYQLATSYRFHFLLFFLADVLEQLNILNKSFQQQELDTAGVHAQIRRTMSHLETRYVNCGDDFGGGLSARLSPFILKYGPDSDKPEVMVQGVDSDGQPTTHKFQLHESPSEDYPTLGTHHACVDLCTSFAETLVRNLSKRFEHLDNLVGVRLFMPDEYPPGRAERHKQCVEWLMSLVSLSRAQETDHILPGINKLRAMKELRAFYPILAGAPNNERSFHAGLTAMLKTSN